MSTETETTEATQKTLRKLKITDLDRTLKTRSEVRESVAEEYAKLIKKKVKLPLPVVFEHDGTFYLSSGFHRIRAAEILELDEIECEVRTGDRLQAISFGCLANKKQLGERLTMADKKAAVALVLSIDGSLSDETIAKKCDVSDTTVWRLRQELSASSQKTLRTGIDGKTYQLPSPRPTTVLTPLPPSGDTQDAPQEENEVTDAPSATLAARTVERIADTMSVIAVEQPKVATTAEAPRPTKSREVLFDEADKALGVVLRTLDNLRDAKAIDYNRNKLLRFLVETTDSFLKGQNVNDGNQVIEECEIALVELVTGLDKMKQFDRDGGVQGVKHACDLGKVLRGAKGQLQAKPAVVEEQRQEDEEP